MKVRRCKIKFRHLSMAEYVDGTLTVDHVRYDDLVSLESFRVGHDERRNMLLITEPDEKGDVYHYIPYWNIRSVSFMHVEES